MSSASSMFSWRASEPSPSSTTAISSRRLKRPRPSVSIRVRNNDVAPAVRRVARGLNHGRPAGLCATLDFVGIDAEQAQFRACPSGSRYSFALPHRVMIVRMIRVNQEFEARELAHGEIRIRVQNRRALDFTIEENRASNFPDD
jgi:hypothetical protein